jgi:hypothetical protein
MHPIEQLPPNVLTCGRKRDCELISYRLAQYSCCAIRTFPHFRREWVFGTIQRKRFGRTAGDHQHIGRVPFQGP